MLLYFRGHCSFRIYMPSKPTKYGLKVMCMTDARSSYFYNGFKYSWCWSIRRTEVFQICSVYYSIIQTNSSNRNITADNYFSSIELVHDLKTPRSCGNNKKKQEIPVEFQPDKYRVVSISLTVFLVIQPWSHTHMYQSKTELFSYYLPCVTSKMINLEPGNN